MKKLVLITSCILGLSYFISAQSLFQVSGLVLDESNKSKLNDIAVNLYCDNELAESHNSGTNGTFYFTLTEDKIYTIEATREGYESKKIQINTVNHKKNNKEIEDLKFNILLSNYEMVDSESTDKYDLDFPVALIQLNNKGTGFIYDEEYIKQMSDLEKIAERESNQGLFATE